MSTYRVQFINQAQFAEIIINQAKSIYQFPSESIIIKSKLKNATVSWNWNSERICVVKSASRIEDYEKRALNKSCIRFYAHVHSSIYYTVNPMWRRQRQTKPLELN